jgi:hypothetical protein
MTEHVRDAAATAFVFGFFASSWFGWAQESPPARWRRWLLGGALLSLLTAVAGGLLTWSHWSDGTAFDRSTSIAFGVVVTLEFVIAGLGAALLAVSGRASLMPAWVAFVVGIHLFPLGTLLGYPLLYVTAALITVLSWAVVPLARRRRVRLSAAVGGATGSVLLATALVSVGSALFAFE